MTARYAQMVLTASIRLTVSPVAPILALHPIVFHAHAMLHCSYKMTYAFYAILINFTKMVAKIAPNTQVRWEILASQELHHAIATAVMFSALIHANHALKRHTRRMEYVSHVDTMRGVQKPVYPLTLASVTSQRVSSSCLIIIAPVHVKFNQMLAPCVILGTTNRLFLQSGILMSVRFVH